MNKATIYNNSKDEWYTPQPVIDYAKQILGGEIDIDPCASSTTNIGKVNYTMEDDGLSQEWKGNMYINPPFSTKNEWIKKAAESDANIVMLLPLAPETKIWNEYILGNADIYIPNKRVSFIDGSTGKVGKGSSFTSVLIHFKKGGNNYVSFRLK